MFKTIEVGELYSNHITEEDNYALDDLSRSRFAEVVVASFDTGWFVEVASVDNGHEYIDLCYERAAMSEAFKKIVLEARKQGLRFLRIHADAEMTEGLEVFDW
jgi:hypothetical protein